MQKLHGRTWSLYRSIYCEVEFEVGICGWQVYPGTLRLLSPVFFFWSCFFFVLNTLIKQLDQFQPFLTRMLL